MATEGTMAPTEDTTGATVEATGEEVEATGEEVDAECFARCITLWRSSSDP